MFDTVKRDLKTTSYYTNPKFGSFVNFFSLLDDNGQIVNNNFEDWQLEILNKDLSYLKTQLNSKEISMKVQSFKNDGYMRNYQKLVDCANSMFGCALNIPLYLVDILPEPFETRGCDSVSVDKEDESKLDIPYGIYFKKPFLTHCYFEFVIAHEIIHQIISFYSNKYFPYTTLIEEGYCDLFAAIILKESKVVNTHTIKQLFLYNRMLKSEDSIWNYYKIAFKRAIVSTFNEGINNSIDKIKKGRESFINIDFKKEINLNHNEKFNFLFELLEIEMELCLDIDEYHVINKCLLNECNEKFINKFKSTLENLNAKGLLIFDQGIVQIIDHDIFSNMRYRI